MSPYVLRTSDETNNWHNKCAPLAILCVRVTLNVIALILLCPLCDGLHWCDTDTDTDEYKMYNKMNMIYAYRVQFTNFFPALQTGLQQ